MHFEHPVLNVGRVGSFVAALEVRNSLRRTDAVTQRGTIKIQLQAECSPRFPRLEV